MKLNLLAKGTQFLNIYIYNFFICSLEQSKSVISFLQNFNKYTELRQHRFNVYTELANSYSEYINLPCGAYSSTLSVEYVLYPFSWIKLT